MKGQPKGLENLENLRKKGRPTQRPFIGRISIRNIFTFIAGKYIF